MQLLMPVDLTVDVSIFRTDASNDRWVGAYPAITQREKAGHDDFTGANQSRLSSAAAAGLRRNEGETAWLLIAPRRFSSRRPCVLSCRLETRSDRIREP